IQHMLQALEQPQATIRKPASKVTPEVLDQIKALRDQGVCIEKISAALKEENIQISAATINRALRADVGLPARSMPKAVTRDILQIILDLKSQKRSSQAISAHLEAGGIHLSKSGVDTALRVASLQFGVTADSESWRNFRETGYQQASPNIQHMLQALGQPQATIRKPASKVTPEVFEKIKALRDQGVACEEISATLKEENIQISAATIKKALRLDAGLPARGMPKAVTPDILQIILDLKSQKRTHQAISDHLKDRGVHLSTTGVDLAYRLARPFLDDDALQLDAAPAADFQQTAEETMT
ncbi:hypothetical protein ABLN87_22200, partial [Ruegeria sp. SCPT10]|uniref:hypothetical protein n=1 Tax=Ruegeria sp. SCP10 TaxID=3141377 RepID=UPI003335BF66